MTIMNDLAKQAREMIVLAVAASQFCKLNNAITNTTQVLDGLQKHKRNNLWCPYCGSEFHFIEYCACSHLDNDNNDKAGNNER